MTIEPETLSRPRGGFTILELAAVLVVIAVMAAFAVPGVRQALERARAGRAFEYLSSVREAQALYSGRNHTYASDPGRLRVAAPVPKGFLVGTIAAGASGDIRNSWTLTLTRCGASEDYGAYTITFNETGFDENSSIPYAVSPNPVR